ncbi:SCO7613 C-terminal domain-containing membrane protein [Streptomyces sp. NPDC048604]|uniref:SCO7613 C-terminal domain-containing membrane protein n=1 Tax=Streptomyces sp. NPDC048604 TaxID=3365578 RepID=UPI00371C387E
MENVLPPADELVLVDRELAQLDARRSQLLARRAWLLQVLRAAAVPQAPAYGTPAAGWAVPPKPVADTTPPSAQNVLLTLGGVLLTIAAIAFTLVSWGSMGIGGRAAVLAVVTGAALAAPVVLLRRGLVSTAESVGALGLVLMVLDAYALHRVALAGTDGVAYTAGASAVLAGAWAAYGTALGGRLRIPLPVAVVAAQLPLPLAAVAADAGAYPLGWAMLATAAADAALLLWVKLQSVRITAAVGLCVTGSWALLTGGWFSLTDPVPAVALLLAGGALALYTGWRTPAVTVFGAVVAALTAVAAVGGVLRSALPESWIVPGYVACGLALAAVLRTKLPRPVRQGALGTGAGVLGLGVLWALPPAAALLLDSAVRTTPVWSGPATPVFPEYPATASLVLLAATAALAPLRHTWSRCTAVLLAWATVLSLPVSLDLGHALRLTVLLLTAVAAGALACRAQWFTRGLPAPAPDRHDRAAADAPAGADHSGDPQGEGEGSSEGSGETLAEGFGPAAGAAPAGTFGAPVWPGWAGARVPVAVREPVAPGVALAWCGFGAAVASAVGAVLSGLDTRAGTFTVLGVLLALFAGVAAFGERRVRAAAACLAVAAAGGLVLAGARAAQLEDHRTAVWLLVVPTAAVGVGARLRRHPLALPVELSGAAVALLAIGLAAGRPASLALVLALCGVLAAAVAAVRPEGRRTAGWTAAVLFVLATWVRLAASDVTTPEAYTLPVTLPALAVGVLRRHRDPEASSWTAYGPGLAATLVPSLIAVWSDPYWGRPLLLGLAALAVTLLGARHRLQAPLVLGGTALALVALHELAPYVVQVVGALPRWLPPALAGLLLLAVGATYEQRLRDARRLREKLGRMH